MTWSLSALIKGGTVVSFLLVSALVCAGILSYARSAPVAVIEIGVIEEKNTSEKQYVEFPYAGELIATVLEAEEPEEESDVAVASNVVIPEEVSPVLEEIVEEESEVYQSLLSMEDRVLLLEAHNDARSDVGVTPLIWSDTLARSAERWADQLQSEGCALRHSDYKGVGENIYYSRKYGDYMTPRKGDEVMDAFLEEENSIRMEVTAVRKEKYVVTTRK